MRGYEYGFSRQKGVEIDRVTTGVPCQAGKKGTYGENSRVVDFSDKTTIGTLIADIKASGVVS
jgi:hypothetical protein